jgi:copper transport protein
VRKVLAGLGLAALFLLGWATPASAHAVLESTDPSAGAVLDRAPERVVLRFSERVEVAIGAVRVFDGTGERLDTGKVARGEGGTAVSVSLPELDNGAYVVTYRVVSADSHPIHGALTFRVGPAGGPDDQALVQRLLAADGGSTVVGAAYAVTRFATFASLLLLVGAVVFLVGLWPDGAATRRLRRTVWGAWAGALISTLLAIGMQGIYAAGLGLADLVRPSVISAVLDTRYGRVSLARAVLLVLGAGVLTLLLRQPRRREVVGAAALLGGGLLVTPGLAGHAGAAHPLALVVGADALHLAAGATWLGGAAVLALCILRSDEETIEQVVPRYARVAFVAVVTIAATGTFEGWRQTESLDAVTSTTYGRLLMGKVALFLTIVGIAAFSRQWVRRRYWRPAPALSPGPGAVASATAADEGRPSPHRLRALVTAEVVIATGVLALTSLLVNAVPARTAVAKPFSAELVAGKVLVEVTIDPAKAGPADVHVYTFDRASGAVADVPELTAELRLPDRGIGPLPLPLQPAGAGHFSAYGVDLPIRGTWRLDVSVRTSDVDVITTSTTVTVR